jgi:glycerophosphoryl diester phosphodiesterase
VSETPLATLKSARLLGGDEHIPTLAEALRRIGGRVPVLVEIKNRGAVGELEDAVARTLAAYEAPVAVISFNPYSLARLAETAPDIPRGQVSAAFRGEDLPFYQKFALRNLLMNWTSRPDFIAYDIQELPWIGTTVQRWRGRPLIGWTAETPAQREDASGLCDALECSPAALVEDQ